MHGYNALLTAGARVWLEKGLLWYDNSSNYIETKIEKAAQRYQEKYGTTPTVAFVNPQDFKTAKVKNIQVQSKATIMPNHIWIGVTQ